ncbi:adenylate/guanylate cyclase domain-containing protein [Sneathiella aquimaris]|uniref:adenylate/guanylate cyclase domain-containing protein n=1 Tax=Sneathiella aquimaris TaxID=2599305 RepID=UPI00146C3E5A|nr:adenylate/guanylate cyclase domain-containing protein [Sneathiella aquimaris]
MGQPFRSGSKKISVDQQKRRSRVTIASALAMSFGPLICIAILAVLGVSLITGLTNTRDLLLEKVTAEMSAVRSNLTNLLDPVELQVRYLSDLIYSGQINIYEEKSFDEALLAGLAGSRKIKGLIFVYPDFKVKIADRSKRKVTNFNKANDPVANATMNEMSHDRVGSWAKLIYTPETRETVLSFRQPIVKEGVFIGVLIAAIPVSSVNDIVKTDGLALDEDRFILYGRDHVLTQKNLSYDTAMLVTEGTVPRLDEIADPILSSIWTAPRTPFRLFGDKLDFEGHFTNLNGERYQFFYATLEGYTDRPLIIGYRVKYEEATREIRRLAYAGMVGLAILIIGIIISVVIGRKISQPIRALSHASRKISDLDFRNVKTLPSSRLKELDEASEAYNTMLRGLSWFENYVPKSLVRKLMETGDAHSESRSVTVMFTDIVSFTPLAERMSSEEVADMLNHHFELVTRCIEDEGGTVDKFIGDAVMAFWGAPENQTDHAARACRAAKAIREAIMADNKIRREKDLDPIRMRIGIHSGTLVVGNIGSSGRINYTVVGDTVNISQRIEQLGKTLCNDDGQEVTILLSETTMNQSNDCLALESVGSHPMKGRNQSIVLYKAS